MAHAHHIQPPHTMPIITGITASERAREREVAEYIRINRAELEWHYKANKAAEEERFRRIENEIEREKRRK